MTEMHMTSPNWGTLHDPDTAQGIQNYSEAGLYLSTPDDIANLTLDQIVGVAASCSQLLDSVYNSNYPKTTKEVNALAKGIHERETHLFTLTDSEARLLAMASLVQRKNSLRGDIGFAELSKAAKLQDAKLTGDVSVRHLSKYRLQWAFENLTETDFIYGSPRTAAAGADGTPGGRQAQSVWWGGRQHGVHLPLIASNAGWNFRVGDIEPLTGFVAPVDAAKWAEAVRELPLYVPNSSIKQILDTLFSEATHDSAKPNIIVTAPANTTVALPAITEARPPMKDIGSKYYLTHESTSLPQKSLENVDEQLTESISQKIIVESDIAGTPQGVPIMELLIKQGWTFAGWQPSEITYGGICPIFARVNPEHLGELTAPMHYPQYFDKGGLSQTRKIFEDIYQSMYDRAASVNSESTTRSKS